MSERQPITFRRLAVLADPEYAGKHPLHDSRFVATDDAEWEYEPRDEDGEQNWYLERGAIIAKMTDCEDQKQMAQLFAQAPVTLDLLRLCCGLLVEKGLTVPAVEAHLQQFTKASA